MAIQTFFVYSEAEFTQFTLQLKEHQIPFESRLLGNIPHVSLNMVNPYSEFLIDELYASTVKQIREEMRINAKDLSDSVEEGRERIIAKNHKKTKPKIRWGTIFLASYALIVTMLLLKSKREMNAFINPESNVDWNWNSTILTETLTDNSSIKTIFFDENLNNKWELVQKYVDGKLVRSYYDENDNGYVERFIEYDINKKS